MAYYILVKIMKDGYEKDIKRYSYSESGKACRKCRSLKTPHLVYYVVDGRKYRVAFRNFSEVE